MERKITSHLYQTVNSLVAQLTSIPALISRRVYHCGVKSHFLTKSLCKLQCGWWCACRIAKDLCNYLYSPFRIVVGAFPLKKKIISLINLEVFQYFHYNSPTLCSCSYGINPVSHKTVIESERIAVAAGLGFCIKFWHFFLFFFNIFLFLTHRIFLVLKQYFVLSVSLVAAL